MDSGDFKFDQKSVEKRLRDGQIEAERISGKKAPKTGYLDTQLFPGKGKPSAYEKDYSYTGSHSGKK